MSSYDFPLKSTIRNLISLLVVALILLSLPLSASAQLILTQEERDFIAQNPVLLAVSLEGGAPGHYRGLNGEIKGISVDVIKEIAKITGLTIEVELYSSIEKALNSGADLGLGVSPEYAGENPVLSIPYYKSETMLYMNSKVKANDLEHKKYALVKGGRIPEKVLPENVLYFNSREACLDAVNAGRADYGYANAHAVVFYTLQNGYKNLISVPVDMADREYSLGLFEENDVLLSILDKAIMEIGERRIQTIILNASTDVERKISLDLILENYGPEIFSLVILLLASLLFSVFTYIRANRQLSVQNQRYELLSILSNEFFVEYFINSGQIDFSNKFANLFEQEEDLEKAINDLKKTLKNLNASRNETGPTIELGLSADDPLTFKLTYAVISDRHGEAYSIIGKLIDISAEIEEMAKLQAQARLDGQTGLYNAHTSKALIEASMARREPNQVGALLLIDCDDFKIINDTYGHLRGDKTLVFIAESLKANFRSEDIIGRIGGDEFCVFINDVHSLDSLKSMTDRLLNLIPGTEQDLLCTISGGAALLDRDLSYQELFEKADACLYKAKNQGGNQIIIHS